MRLVANWELDGVVASQGRARRDRIVASTPTPVECAAIARHFDIEAADLDWDDSWEQVEMPICELISRCELNVVSEPLVSSMPLLNCCPDLFPGRKLEGIREAGRVASEAFAKCLERPEALFLLDSLCYYNSSRLRRHLIDTDPTLTLEDAFLEDALERLERTIVERVMRKIAVMQKIA